MCIRDQIKIPTKIVDLLDRLLDKGMILNADLIISVAGVPLIGISLKAALASIETMLDYGMMEAWDQSIRDWYQGFGKSGISAAHGWRSLKLEISGNLGY